MINFRAEKGIQRKAIKQPTMSLERQKQRLREKANVDKRLKEYQRPPISLVSGTPTPTTVTILKSSRLEETPNIYSESSGNGPNLKRSHLNNTLNSPEERTLQKSISGSSIGSSSAEKRKRRLSENEQPTRKRRDSEKSNVQRQISKQFDHNESDFDPTPLRKNVTKGLKDALKTRVEKTEGLTISDNDLDNLVTDIEEALYKLYNRDVGNRYKSKYRSLVFNMKDPKNNGLFRKVIRKEYSPNRIVAMTAEEMANKELKEWRQAELKHDIDKIKSHEIEMAQLGTKFVMKTHKGDMVMEDGKSSSMAELKNNEVKLPDEVSIYRILRTISPRN